MRVPDMGKDGNAFLCGLRESRRAWEDPPQSLSEKVANMPACKRRLSYDKHRAGMLCFQCKTWVLREMARLRTEGMIGSRDFKTLREGIDLHKAGEKAVERATAAAALARKQRKAAVRTPATAAAQRAKLPPNEVKFLQ